VLRSILIGLVAGQRAMTPLALVAGAARRGTLPDDAPELLRHPAVAAGAVALAAAEMAGDKMPSAPNRTVVAGLLARAATAGLAGAALAPKEQRRTAAALAVATAVASSYVGLALRLAAMRRYGQTTTGFAEDAVLVAGGLAVVGAVGA
jgi:uncharacterized membrane protein